MLIGEYLVNHGVLQKDDLHKALEIQKLFPQKKLGEILIEMEVITIDTLIKFLELQLKDKFKKT